MKKDHVVTRNVLRPCGPTDLSLRMSVKLLGTSLKMTLLNKIGMNQSVNPNFKINYHLSKRYT